MYKYHSLVLLTAVVATLFMSNIVGAAVKGEIININYDYDVAFTDLTRDELSQGDIVEVLKGKKHITYLRVIETSAALSKLAPVQSEKYQSDVEEFAKIKIGLTVKLLEQNPTSGEGGPAKGDQKELTLQQKYDQTVLQLEDALNQIRELKAINQTIERNQGDSSPGLLEIYEENNAYREEIEQLKSKLSRLEKRLHRMSALLREAGQ